MSQEKSERNRRLNFRRPVKGRTKVVCRKGALDLGQNLAVATLNVSETGVRLMLQAELPRGQEVTLTLESPDRLRPIKLLGNVAWCSAEGGQWQVGISFQKRLKYADFIRLT